MVPAIHMDGHWNIYGKICVRNPLGIQMQVGNSGSRRSNAAPAEPAPGAFGEEVEALKGNLVKPPAALVPGGKARSRLPDSEKLTINLGSVDLGTIDLLVAEGFYSNRSDLIRTAVRNLLSTHRDVVNNALTRQERTLGLRRISRPELEALQTAGQHIRISVVGLVVIDDDVTPALAQETIASLSVLGSLQASAEVRRALAGRLV